jgi:hypothetical protein
MVIGLGLGIDNVPSFENLGHLGGILGSNPAAAYNRLLKILVYL